MYKKAPGFCPGPHVCKEAPGFRPAHRDPDDRARFPLLKLQFDEPLSNDTYDFELRLYSLAPDTMDDTAEHLTKRTEHKSPVVKLKALRAVKYLCARGDPRFKRAMSKHSAGAYTRSR